MNIDFINWAEKELSSVNLEDIVALKFNISESGKSQWLINIVGTASFDEVDEDWACDEIFTDRNHPYIWLEENGREKILNEVIGWVCCLTERKMVAELMDYIQGIGVGFVDGHIAIIYNNL